MAAKDIAKSEKQGEQVTEPTSIALNGVTVEPFDPFADLSHQRVGQNFGTALGIQKQQGNVPLRKPKKSEFFRVHPSPEYLLETSLLESELDGETYMVDRSLWPLVEGYMSQRVLYTCVSRQGVSFLWPCKRPGENVKFNSWSESALAAAQQAMKMWVRIVPNMGAGGYDIIFPEGEYPEPEWKETPLNELARIAFKGRYIRTEDHIVIRQLRGRD